MGRDDRPATGSLQTMPPTGDADPHMVPQDPLEGPNDFAGRQLTRSTTDKKAQEVVLDKLFPLVASDLTSDIPVL